MTVDEKITMLKTLIENPNEDELKSLLYLAGEAILDKLQPFGERTVEEVPTKYESIQIRLVVEMYNRHGAEGQTSYSENGISRTFQNDSPLLDKVTPLAYALAKE